MFRPVLLAIFCHLFALAQPDSSYIIKVHFLYGSKPNKGTKGTEMKYFGGKHGGHVSIEVDSVDVGFVPSGGVHIFSQKNNKKAAFADSRTRGLPVYPKGNKTAVFYIPLNRSQYERINAIHRSYLDTTPYDYAFLGMRCASATYDILAQLDLVNRYSRSKTSRKIFYPKILRKKLFVLAKKKGWEVVRQEGRPTRKWEKD